MVNSISALQIIKQEKQTLQNIGANHVSIGLSEVLGRGKRLDASYYDAEGRRIRQIIADCPYPKIPLYGENGFAKNVFYLSRFRRIFVNNGIPIFTASHILDFNPRPDKFISRRTKANIEELVLKEGQIVVTRSGSIGFCSIVTGVLKGKIFSDDLIRIECDNPNDTGYVYAFLKTSIGHKLLTTNNYGSVITHIEPEHLEKVTIPNFPDDIKRGIHVNIMTAFKLRDDAYELLRSADELLVERLNLPSLESLKIKYLSAEPDLRSFSVKISEWKHRFDGSFHIPIITEIVKQLERCPAELTFLGDKRISKKIFLPGRFKRVYVSEDYGAPFLSGGDILQFDPKKEKYLSKKHHDKRINEQLVLHENMILVTRSGTVGNTILVPEHLTGWVANEHILRIIPNEETNAGYIYAFLASDYGRELVKRFTYGSVVDEIGEDQLASVEFPLPSRKIQDEIGNLVLEAKRKYSEAYAIEKATIRKVEEIILSSLIVSIPDKFPS